MPTFYIMVGAVIAILPIVLIPETARKPIRHATAVPGTEPTLATA